MKKKSPKRSPALKLLSGLGYGFFLFFALAAGTLYGWAGKSSLLKRMLTHPSELLRPKPPEEVFDGKDSLTLLLLGCDEDRFYHGTYLHGSNIRRKYARADMIMVARLDFKNHRITGLSIPRDTQCRLPGYPVHKINAYHAIAPKGQENALMEQAVQHVLPGVDIDRVVVLDFDSMQQLVDSVGGVEVNVPKKMDYDDNAGNLHIHLKPGLQHLDGYNAMGYVRFRHDRESDFGRQARQKDFLVSFKSSIFQNPLELPAVAEKAKSVLNNALTDEEILSLAAFSRSVNPKSISMGMVPVVEGRRNSLVIDEDKLPDALEKFGLVPGSGTRVSDR